MSRAAKLTQLMVVCAMLVPFGCRSTPKSAKIDWNDTYAETVRQLRAVSFIGEEEWRMMAAEEVQARFMPEQARTFDSIIIEDPMKAYDEMASRSDVDPVVCRISKPGIAEEFGALVEFRPIEAAVTTYGRECNCVSTASIRFLRGTKVVASWDIAHGHILSPGLLTQRSEERIARWLSVHGLPQIRGWVVVLGAQVQ